MSKQPSGTHAAVLFVGEKGIQRQMLINEFDALIAGGVPLKDYKDQDAKAVYVLIDAFGNIMSLVFFTLYFDEDGVPDSSWNIPVERLATISARGPDLGSGPIRLACRSQCSINWHQKELWDPDMTPGRNHFLLIRKVVAKNKLGIAFKEPSEAPVAGKAVEADPMDLEGDSKKRQKLARLIKEQRLRIRTLESHRERDADDLNREQRIIIHAYKNEIQGLKQNIAQMKVQNEKLIKQIELSADHSESIDLGAPNHGAAMNELQRQMASASEDEKVALENKKLKIEIEKLKEELDRKDIDLAYRDEREDQLRAEMDEVKEAYSAYANDPANQSDNKLLDVLKELEIIFTAYHPGVGHLTMTNSELRDYLKSPRAFVARKCFVTESKYQAWLDFTENNSCMHRETDGSLCGESLEKVSIPSEFEPGISDRCDRHQVS